VLRIPGVCTGGGEDTVFAHIRDRHTGRSVKASDLSGADACFACHDVFDRRAKLPSGEYLSDFEWLFYGLRGFQETIERRVAQGLLFVTQDVVKSFGERRAKPRKPPEQRAKVGGKSQWPEQSRPIQSRNNLRKSERQTEDME
jgi:hypothetical protein